MIIWSIQTHLCHKMKRILFWWCLTPDGHNGPDGDKVFFLWFFRLSSGSICIGYKRKTGVRHAASGPQRSLAASLSSQRLGHLLVTQTHNSQVDCGTGTMLSWYRRVQSLHHQQSEPGRMDPHCPVVHAVAWPYPLNVATEINQWNLYFEPFCVLIHNKK